MRGRLKSQPLRNTKTIKLEIMEGYSKGETCNRNGCTGIIDEHEKEGSCTCHINPPCSRCTTNAEYCPLCEWEAKDEEVKAATSKTTYDPFRVKTKADLDRTKIDWVHESHTHFSMKKIGVYPEGTTRQEVEEKVKGTFGGRFERFDKGEFVYVAYTD